MINDFNNKKVAVLGLGIEGVSSVRFLLKHGAEVTVLDQKEDIEKDIKILGYKDIKIKSGENYLDNFDQYDVIVRSPGVRRFLPELFLAEKNGVIITSQTKIFFDLCPGKIIGVTGTKGKGTTCSLIYEMLRKKGLDAYLGGNIGKPPLDFLDKLNTQSIVVLELSSFQLQDLTKTPHIGVVLMITSEHLDYHKDVYEYVDAKRNIIRFQVNNDFAILNKDYPASRELARFTKAKTFWVSRKGEVEEGCFVKDGKIILSMGNGNETRIVRGLRQTSPLNQTGIVTPQRTTVIDVKDILLPGAHNLENVAAAVMASALNGVTIANMVSVLKTFKGLEHRLELAAEVNGVRYYDDSFSTTPETAIAAIKAFKDPEILILGGSTKGSDFTELGRVISSAQNIKAIIGIGIEWRRIKERLKIKDLRCKIYEDCKNMKQIVQKAAEIVEKGDVVLLSPACASFDMFRNYNDRGEQFKKEVRRLR